MKRGAGWEARLESWHRDYRGARSAYVVRCNPPINLQTHGPPDYMGLLAGGRPVVFDAKHQQRGKWALSKLASKRSKKPHHQAQDLESAQEHGGLSFIALRLGTTGYVLPWRALGPMYWDWVAAGMPPRGTAVDALAIGIPMNSSGWLDAVEKMWGSR